MIPNSLRARDIASLVHQQTDLDHHSREGIRVRDTDGHEYIEAMSGPPLIMTAAEATELCIRFRNGLDRAHARLSAEQRAA